MQLKAPAARRQFAMGRGGVERKSSTAVAAIVDDGALSPAQKLKASLDRAGFWGVAQLCGTDQPRIVIKPELAGFRLGSPSITDPVLVEELIDQLHDRGYTDVAVVDSADSSSLWAGNRDLYALSDLLGYRFSTPKGRSYDIIDLGDHQAAWGFPADSVLHGTGLSEVWLNADLRIVFTKNRTDEVDGYALCLDTLIGVLPLTDKTLHYRQRRHRGDVAAALLQVAAPHFCIIDAIVSAHGAGGRRAPTEIDTRTIIAASDAVLADYIGALKMGIDPATSRMFARVARFHPLPGRYTVSGSLIAYSAWQNVPPASMRASQMRSEAGSLDRLVEPWLQQLDPELFPLSHPLDAKLNSMLSTFLDSNSTTGQALLTLVNALLGSIGQAISSYRTMLDKDALQQHAVPLGIDVNEIEARAFENLVEELRQIEPIAAEAPQVSDELRWRYVDKSIVFSYTRVLPIDHALFVSRVDIARTIQFMNDYLGGVVVPLAHDAEGRPIRQAERNIYLPQPNYLVLYQGQPIDVSKLEVVEYGTGRCRLYWKTISSENGSATHDDGIATFERVADGTCITIVGRQQFTLPLFWQVFDLDLIPDLKAMLVTHAYRTFFDRTIANFEALVEGREIRIGRPVDEPAPRPLEQLMPLLERIGEIAMPMLQRLTGKASQAASDNRQLDADGFVHVSPAQSANNQSPDNLDAWVAVITRFLEGFVRAVWRDIPHAGPMA